MASDGTSGISEEITSSEVPEVNASTEAPRTPTASTQTTETKLFDTIERFRHLPLFYDGLLKVKWKIEHGTLSGRYHIADFSPNHKDVLLNLVGRIACDYESFFGIAQDDEETRELQVTYGFADANGICFNYDLITSCHEWHTQNGFSNVQEALGTLQGLSFSGVIQETFEHELAHRKIRADLLHRLGRLDTPPGNPLESESGFAVQREIRRLHARETSLTDGELHILEVPETVQRNRYRPPLNLHRGSFHIEGGEITSRITGDRPIGMDELVRHLSYGGIDPTKPVPTRSGDGDGDAGPPSSNKKRGLDSEGREDVGGKRPAVVRARSKASSSMFTPNIMPTAENPGREENLNQTKAEADDDEPVENPPHAQAKDLDPEGPQRDLYEEIAKAKDWDLFDTAKHATLTVEFLDMHGKCRERFSSSESIFVSLKYFNPTKNYIYVKLARRNFARGAGMTPCIDGAVERHRRSIRNAMVAAKIAPSGSHTFMPRKLCEGPEPDANTKAQDHNHGMVPFWTPSKAGKYTLEFYGLKKKFDFVIVKDGDDDVASA